MKNRLLFIIAMVVGLVGISIELNAQKLKTIVDFDVINVGDTITVSYLYAGSLDDIKVFSKSDLAPFVIVGGPYQISSTGSSFIKEDTAMVSITALTYKLMMSKEGMYEIKPVSIETKSNALYTSNGVKVRVGGRSDKKHKTSDWAFMQGRLVSPSFDPYDDLGDPYETLDESKLAKAHSKINSSPKDFALITGWIYRDDATKENSDIVLNEVNQYLIGLKNVDLLDSLKDDRMPRYYYAINDTENIRKQLDPIFEKAGFGNKAAIIFSSPEEWTIKDETIAFSSKSDTWFLIYSLMKQAKLDKATAKIKTEKLLMRFSFSRLSKMEALIQYAEKQDYVVVKKNTTTSQNDYYTVDFSKQCIMNENEIYKVIDVITSRGLQQGFKCDISALGIDK